MNDSSNLAERLRAADQAHLLAGIEFLEETRREAFRERLAAIDWQELRNPAATVPITAVEQSRVIDADERQQRHDELTAAGADAYRAGMVAVVMVAGGQGTRLGHDGPKGCFAIGAHSGKSIYQIQAEKVLAAGHRYGVRIPFAIMTSPMTDDDTRDYFAAHDCFGLDSDQVLFFSQGTVPSLDEQGRALLVEPGRLLENPDGHGGCHTALVASGTLDALEERGIRHLVYIQVDNILAPVDDPILVGLAAVASADVVTKVFAKRDPDEKLGHLVRVAGHDRIIEYTELTPEQVRSTDATGNLVFRWGSPAMHCWSVAFFRRLADTGFKLPLHRSSKPLQAWQDGDTVTVQGWKSERFIFDLLPEATVSLGLVADREEEFAPVKNRSGDDSPDSCRHIASDCYRRWLEAAGVEVSLPEGALIEISPLFASNRTHFLERWDGRLTALCGPYYLEP